MKKIVFVVVLVIFMITTFVVQAQLPEGRPVSPQDFPTAKSSVKKVIELDLSWAENPGRDIAAGVEIVRDIVYADRDGTKLKMIVLYPKGTKSPLPCVVYVPGSAWMKQHIEMSVPNMSRVAVRGFVVSIVEYRPSAIGKFPAQVQDAKTAVRFMRKNAGKYYVDTSHIVGWGDSSGGHVSLFMGFTQGNRQLDTDLYAGYSDKINAVIDFYGPSELSKMADYPSIMDHSLATSPEGMLIGGSVVENSKTARIASPVYYITEAAVPTLIAHGDRDMIVPFNQSDLVAEALDKVHAEYEYYCLLGAGHGSREFWTKELFDIVEAFIRKHTRPVEK